MWRAQSPARRPVVTPAPPLTKMAMQKAVLPHLQLGKVPAAERDADFNINALTDSPNGLRHLCHLSSSGAGHTPRYNRGTSPGPCSPRASPMRNRPSMARQSFVTPILSISRTSSAGST
jgi:hypothetical protein